MKRFISLILAVIIASAMLTGAGAAAAGIPGDTNGDGEIDNKDVVVLFRYVSGNKSGAVEENCDYNGDGETDNKDVVALFRAVSEGLPSIITGEFIITPDESATLSVPRVFGDHMVLQRDSVIKVWGVSNKNGAGIRGTFMGDVVRGIVRNGKWEIKFSPKAATKDPQSLKIEDTCGNTVEFTDILVGDVWFIGGQSNAVRTMSQIGATPKASKTMPVRVFQQDESDVWNNRTASANPCDDVINPKRCWRVSNRASATVFSAIGWYVCSRLAEETDIPQGAVCIAAGGASICEFMPKETADKFSYKKGIYVNAAEHYNGLINPFVGMSFKAMVFFQGEAEGGTNSVPSSMNYARDFEALMTELRSRWGFDFPIYNVQISDYPGEECETYWTHVGDVRAQQYDAYKKMSGVRLIPSYDIGSKTTDPDGAHSPYKKELSDRISSLALADLYGVGKADDALAPEPDKITVVSSTAQEKVIDIKFKYAGDGLVSLSGSDTVSGFMSGKSVHPYLNEKNTVSGKIISKDTVRVTVPANCLYIGYASAYRTMKDDVPVMQLYNSNGLPALAFYLELK